MNDNASLGRRGEQAAAAYLVGLGWTILDRNWRCPEGELDIIAHDGRRPVVCEVKTRSTAAYGAPLEAITPDKAARLRRLAGRWAAAHRIRSADVRIDVLGLIPCAAPSPVEAGGRGVSWIVRGASRKRRPAARAGKYNARHRRTAGPLPGGGHYAESCGFSVEHVRGVC
ncbi:YraN family protein [Actinomadura sp. NPDC047616]|uniref:YraN family protein n=1 Tax=Actinomadura sp. NPDC047616 TaxID=3155914 RepID=UPI0033FD67DA